MPARHATAEGYFAENRAHRQDLTPPHDGAVFYTNGARDDAVAYAARQNAKGIPTVTLEGDKDTGRYGTTQGARIDRDALFDNSDPATRAFNDHDANYRARAMGAHPSSTSGARRVWADTSTAYATTASGKVVVCTGGQAIRSGSYFARHERDVLIRNREITTINGVNRSELAQLLDKRDRGEIPGIEAEREINSRIVAGAPDKRVSKPGQPPSPPLSSPWDARKSDRPAPLAAPKKTK